WSSDVCSSDLVDAVVGDDMRVEVAHGAVYLSGQLHAGNLFALTFQPVNHIRQFLADGRGAGGLPVGAREHGDIGKLMRHRRQLDDDPVDLREQHHVARFLQHQSVSKIIDVFRGAGEVNEFADLPELGDVGDFFLEEVLDGFDIM